MLLENIFTTKLLAAKFAREWLLSGMGADVDGQVCREGELSRAHRAFVGHSHG